MWIDENEGNENGCPDYNLQSDSSIDKDFSELRHLFSEQQESSIGIIEFHFETNFSSLSEINFQFFSTKNLIKSTSLSFKLE